MRRFGVAFLSWVPGLCLVWGVYLIGGTSQTPFWQIVLGSAFLGVFLGTLRLPRKWWEQ